jgi:hypothetical protein
MRARCAYDAATSIIRSSCPAGTQSSHGEPSIPLVRGSFRVLHKCGVVAHTKHSSNAENLTVLRTASSKLRMSFRSGLTDNRLDDCPCIVLASADSAWRRIRH